MNTIVTKQATVSGALNPAEIKALKNTWLNCPIDQLSDMFYAQVAGTNQKVLCYQLPPSAFSEMMNTFQMAKAADKNGILKIHMGCVEEWMESTSPSDNPAFTPFIQLHLSGDDGNANCYRCEWQPITAPLSKEEIHQTKSDSPRVTSEYNPSRISPNSAYLFLKEWRMTNQVELPDLFTGVIEDKSVRLNCTTFVEQTLNDIYKLWEADQSRNLFLHLASIKADDRSPFGFHVVLEVVKGMTTMNGNIDAKDSIFFEFSTPCPPYCKSC